VFLTLTSQGPGPRRARRRRIGPARPRGAVLLEVVLALVLFVGAAAVITGGINASLNGVERLRLNTHAANLAISVLAELQMGARTTELTGPEPFDLPFENWTWELVPTPVEDELGEESRLTSVEVIIRHLTEPVVYRLTQVLRLEDEERVDEAPGGVLSF